MTIARFSTLSQIDRSAKRIKGGRYGTVEYDSMGKGIPIVYGTRLVAGIPVFVREPVAGGAIYLPKAALLEIINGEFKDKNWTEDINHIRPDGWAETRRLPYDVLNGPGEADVMQGNQGSIAAEIALCAGPIAGVLGCWRGDDFFPIEYLGTYEPQQGLESYNRNPELLPGTEDQSYWSYVDRWGGGVLRTPLARTAYVRCVSFGCPDGSLPDFRFEVRGLFPNVDADELLGEWAPTGAYSSGSPLDYFDGPGWVIQTVTIPRPGAYRFALYKGVTDFHFLEDKTGTFGLEVSITKAVGGSVILNDTLLRADQYNFDVLFNEAGAYNVEIRYHDDATKEYKPRVYFGRVTLVPLDVSPADVLVDLLTNDIYGLGLSVDSIEVDIGPDGQEDSGYRRYCAAMGFHVSGLIDAQTSAIDAIRNLLESTNATSVWSDGKLKVLPLGDETVTRGSVTYTPPTYSVSLGPADFIVKSPGEDPVEVTRVSSADAYNICPVSFADRSNGYESNTIQAPLLASIAAEGRKVGAELDSKWITSAAHAKAISAIRAKRSTYVRNTYHFFLSWRHAALEPGDLVLLTEPKLGLENQWARIVTIEEDAEGYLEVWAEECPIAPSIGIVLPQLTYDPVSPIRELREAYGGLKAGAAAAAALELVGSKVEIDFSNITAVPAEKIPNLDMGKITTGSLATGRLTGAIGSWPTWLADLCVGPEHIQVGAVELAHLATTLQGYLVGAGEPSLPWNGSFERYEYQLLCPPLWTFDGDGPEFYESMLVDTNPSTGLCRNGAACLRFRDTWSNYGLPRKMTSDQFPAPRNSTGQVRVRFSFMRGDTPWGYPDDNLQLCVRLHQYTSQGDYLTTDEWLDTAWTSQHVGAHVWFDVDWDVYLYEGTAFLAVELYDIGGANGQGESEFWFDGIAVEPKPY